MTVPRPCAESRCSCTRRTFSKSRAWSLGGRARPGANRGRMSSSGRPGVASGDCPRTAVTTEPLRTFAATSAPAFQAADCSRPLPLGPGGAERASGKRNRRSTLSGTVVAPVRDKQKPTRSGHTPDMTPAEQRLAGVSGTAGSRGCVPRGARWVDCHAPGAPRCKRDDSTSADAPGVGRHQGLARYAHVRPGSAACSVSRACIGRLRNRPFRRPEGSVPRRRACRSAPGGFRARCTSQNIACYNAESHCPQGRSSVSTRAVVPPSACAARLCLPRSPPRNPCP